MTKLQKKLKELARVNSEESGDSTERIDEVLSKVTEDCEAYCEEVEQAFDVLQEQFQDSITEEMKRCMKSSR